MPYNRSQEAARRACQAHHAAARAQHRRDWTDMQLQDWLMSKIFSGPVAASAVKPSIAKRRRGHS